MRKRAAALSVVLTFLSTTTNACRNAPLEQVYRWSDIALVGFVSSVSIPSLEEIDSKLTSETALGRLAWGDRVVRVVVSSVRKGRASKVQVVEVSACNGGWVEPGDRVVALHIKDGQWQLEKLKPQKIELPPLAFPPVR